MSDLPRRIDVVGAGPVGCLLAVQFIRRGFAVDLYESRPDIRRQTIAAGRSINLALSLRGIHALARLGIERRILEHAIPMYGRMVHDPRGTLAFSRYGVDDSQYINSIARAELNRALLDEAERQGCRIHFEHRLVDYAVGGGELRFARTGGGERTVVSECVIGSDGSASALRQALAGAGHVRVNEEPLDYGYKEVTIPPGPGETFRLEKNALHIWPRGTYMLIALPNRDGSFTGTLFLPYQAQKAGDPCFDAFDDSPAGRARLREFFAARFPDAHALIADLETSFYANPTGKMATVRCSPWHFGGRALLIGDAAHAIVPFYGQGLNCSFEDCTLLDEILERLTTPADLSSAFAEFSSGRKEDTDAIAHLALDNFVEMRDKVSSPRFLLEKEIEKLLMQRFPEDYTSRYGLVTFSRRPYREALRAGQAQDALLARLSEGRSRVDEIAPQLTEELMRNYRAELARLPTPHR